MEHSKIQWTDHTFNPWRGCTKISEGCVNCYAERDSRRNPAVLGVWGPQGTREIASEAQWRNPPKWNREAEKAGVRARVFCASLADIFEGPDTMPESVGFDAEAMVAWTMAEAYYTPSLGNDEVCVARERLFRLIDSTPHLDWLLLTKRPQNVMPIYGPYLQFARGSVWPANLWIGATTENQKTADERCPEIIKIKNSGCKTVFVSCEPLLGPVDLRPWLDKQRGIGWVICGGESGAADKVRPMDLMWARTLRDQCGDAGVPYFFKQTGVGVVGLSVKGKGGDLEDIPEDLRIRELPV